MSRPIKKRPVEIPRPTLYFNFDTELISGGTIIDIMGQNNAATVGSPISVNARRGQGQKLSSSNPDYFTVTNSSSWQLGTADYTVAQVISLDSSGRIDSASRNDLPNTSPGFGLFVSAAFGVIAIHCDGSAPRLVATIATPSGPDDGVFHHVAFSASRSGNATVYWDGQAIGSLDISGQTGSLNSGLGLLIGSQYQAGSPLAISNGTIDEFLLWNNVALTAEQIAELAARSLARKRAFAQVPITDYNIWWSARNVDGEGNTTLSTPNVATLTDHGSTGANATQGTSAKQPFLRPFRSGSRPGILFDGIDDVLTFASQSFGNFTMMCVIRTLENITEAQGNILLLENNAQVSPWGFVHIGASTGAIADEVVTLGYNEFAVDLIVQSIQNDTILSSKPAALMVKLDGTRPTLRYDTKAKSSSFGSLLDTLTFDSSAAQSLVNITSIGGRDTSPKYSNFILHEMLLYDRALSETEILAIENWMAEEYPDLEFQQLVFATNPDTTVEDEPVTVNVEAAGQYPEPTAYWSMDNSDVVGTTMIDLVGGFNGSISSPSSSTGQVKQARNFNGTSDVIDMGDVLDVGLTENFTVSAWFKTTGTVTTSSDQIICKRVFSGLFEGWSLRINPTTGYPHFIFFRSGFPDAAISPSIAVDDSQWHHLLATVDRPVGSWLYLDGVLVGSKSVDVTTTDVSNSAPLFIGAGDVIASNFFDGDIDEVAIWKVNLTANQAVEVYQRGAQGLKLVE